MAGALDGLRVIDMTSVVMGPTATQLLGDYGADIIKVEAPAGRPIQPTVAAPAVPVATARPAVSAAPATREKSTAAPFNKNDFKNDPLIQKALEIYKGQIVEVRA